ncbi:MAG: DUF4241 domain-containing protein, partial [Chloroflexi bacterium]
MSAREPLVSDRAGLAIAALAILVALGGALLLGHTKPAPDLNRYARLGTARQGVEVVTNLYAIQTGRIIDAVADVSIVNNGDKALAYIGVACSVPVTVVFHTTRPDPPGPTYSASATALRLRVMQYRHSLDETLTFQVPQETKPPLVPDCDATAPPTLPPHKRLDFHLTSPLVLDGQPTVDAATTEVVTTLELGDLPQAGSPPAPIQTTQMIEVNTPLRQVSSYAVASRADLATTSARFDRLMKDPAAAAWIDAQDPSSWSEARLMDYSPAAGKWTLTAFNRQFAMPLVVIGSAEPSLSIRIPQQRALQPLEATALIPVGAISHSPDYVASQDLYVGDLVLPSGKVMVGDPVSSDSMLMFDLGLAPGHYPIHVVTGRPRYLGESWARVAWETLTLSSQPVTHWESAIPVGHSAKELKPGEEFEWGTDGGTGGFSSPEAMKVMDASLMKDGDQAVYYSLGESEEANGWLWGFVTVNQQTGANVFACESGFGDGGYPVFIGLDASNKPAVLLSD